MTGGMVAEKRSVCSGGQSGNDPLEIGEKTHVQHPVGLIKDQRMQLIEAACSAHMVEEPARGGDTISTPARTAFSAGDGSAADE